MKETNHISIYSMENNFLYMIRKTLSFTPNMVDYETRYKTFKWDCSFNELAWLPGGKLNAAHEAIDRQADGPQRNKVALHYKDGNGKNKKFTFLDMKKLSNKFANLLKSHGVKTGDRIFIFLPRSPELYISFLGILKTGAIAGTLFSAFGTEGLVDRLGDSGAKFVITDMNLKERVDQVKKELPKLKKVIVVGGRPKGSDEINYRKEMAKASDEYEVQPMNPDDKAFMLYTSGTTGKPKGICHAHRAIAQQRLSTKWILDLRDDDVYWCTADPGWVTGISYGILGHWSNGITSVVYGGRFDIDMWYSIIDEYKVTVWYTAPTAIRLLMTGKKKLLKRHNLGSLRHICSVGEPLNPEAVRWGIKNLGLAIHDSWWQTETGGILISNYAALPIKPGSMGKPFPGIVAAIVDDHGKKLPIGKEGNLAIKSPWPSMMKEVWRNEKKYKSCFKRKWYISGDKAWQDADGYFWFVGRADDVIKTAGERVGPFEVESALIEHPNIVEAGVIGKPDKLRGEIVKAFVVVKGIKPDENFKNMLKVFVKKRLAGHAYPREIEFVETLPKTRSGKIMRRILKAKELGLPIGDTSTLE